VKEILDNVEKNKDKGRINTSLMLYGEGDGGGGPCLWHIKRMVHAKDFDGIPKVKFSTCHEFFKEAYETQNKLMTWEGELYLELHNGTYTSMAEHKFYNRFMETLLRDVEILHYLSHLGSKQTQDPTHDEIREMWYVFMIDQFHDVLPGTCTFMTVDDTRENFKNLKAKSKEISEASIRALLPDLQVNKLERIRPRYDTLSFDPKTEMVVILNSLNFDRFDWFSCKNSTDENEKFYGYCLSPQMGKTCFDKTLLDRSSDG
jgi:alpha-mannosidase